MRTRVRVVRKAEANKNGVTITAKKIIYVTNYAVSYSSLSVGPSVGIEEEEEEGYNSL
jgi:hypothetical protein